MNNEFDMIQIRNQLTGRCLHSYYTSNVVDAVTCNSASTEQLWMWIDRSSDGSQALQSRYNTQCMTPGGTGCSAAYVYACDTGNIRQHWLVRDGALLENEACSTCVTASSGSGVTLAQCGGNNFQYWEFIPLVSGLINETGIVNESALVNE